MTEYWVSKKQYWCKYCNIFIRDDAPSRSHHENGLRHQGNKDRFLRNIYKTGEKSVREKEDEARIMKKIEQQALASHTAAQPKDDSESEPSSSRPPPPPKKTDKFSNYSTAASLGYVDTQADIDAAKEAAEAERKKVGQAGQWETVAVYEPPVDEDAEITQSTSGLPNILGGGGEEEDVRNFAFDTPSAEAGPSTKRRKRDVYDDEGFDPDELLKKARYKQETKRQQEEREAREKEEKGLNREKWKGIVLGLDGKPITKAEETQSDLKREEASPDQSVDAPAAPDYASSDQQDSKPAVEDEDAKPKVEQNSLFKRRRPMNANRSTRQK
ncbi:hypothetical protein HD553DRAFT_67467 [Filobasidium floriforme]|uniref:uncharacterized protein n=1 Tax=Filobasidium floriforme TaxID=5210 RepID=UPI001E8D38D5|nr:uncharacterized protein HD553DRAFT_67467 [Filobasidium floriforme]KAH8082206.1 hypothetical protein HD553DRAFT_67467 [Filobasidium floriforme]